MDSDLYFFVEIKIYCLLPIVITVFYCKKGHFVTSKSNITQVSESFSNESINFRRVPSFLWNFGDVES